ncbi:MAG: hypothetical protein GF331_01285 [Chitinivibrionales bacterium]|nr:hypothetical protein [Chitinivibrionales bacterium]
MTPEEVRLLMAQPAQSALAEHVTDDPDRFALTNAGRDDIPVRAIAEQIACRRKAAVKLPFLTGTDFLYDSLGLQQCSGEAAARYRATLLNGRRLLDLTGGLGIDSLFLSRRFDEVHYCERDPSLLALFEANRRVLGLDNVIVHKGDSIETLSRFPENYFDWVYADPSRRDNHGRHVVLQRCAPNIIDAFPVIAARARHLCIKASPLLEPSALGAELPGVEWARFISAGGECKELVLFARTDGKQCSMRTAAVVLGSRGDTLFELNDDGREQECAAADTLGQLIFDPDPAITRAGLWRQLGARFGLRTVNRTTGLLTGDTVPGTFPGRVFEVNAAMVWRRAAVRRYLQEHGVSHATVGCRDFPMRPDELRALLSLGEGDRDVLLFTRNHRGEKLCIHCIRPAADDRQPERSIGEP